MKRNILLLTTIYPAPDLKYGTSAIHYFAREWVKMGYTVKVIHFQAVYPSIFYFAAKLFRDIIASRTGNIVFTNKENEDKRYNLDGVLVDRYPIFKWIPHGRYTKVVFRKQIDKIINKNKEDDFIPEIIIGHFSNPQLKIVSELKKIYSARTCMIMHDSGNSITKIYKNDYYDLMKNIDIWGYRSTQIMKRFEKNFGKQECSFLCYSGIPASYIMQENKRNFTKELSRFVYVGELIKRKYPKALVHAINDVYKDNRYIISFIGKGAEDNSIRALVESLKIEGCVKLKGHVPRNEVQTILDDSECLIMISANETFGLVYLEAMGRGCITIGSRNEGIDGIIQHGINGFLCQAGNDMELADIIRQINSLTPELRKQISQNAIATAKELTDYKAAKKYITSIDY